VRKQAIGNLILKILIVLVAVAAVVVTIVLCVKANSDNRLIRKELNIEAGSTEFSAADFLRDTSLTARFSAESQYNLNKVGSYQLQLIVGEERYNVILHVVDTVKPVATTKPMLVALGTNLAPEQLLTSISDATAVYVEYEKAPDTKVAGEQDVSVLLTDEGGNMLRLATKIYVTETVNRIIYQLGDPYPQLSEFIGEDAYAEFSPPLSQLNIKTPGTYYLDVNIFDSVYSVIMDAVDTVSPVAQPAQGIEIYPGTSLPDPRQMVVDVFDATELSFAYADDYQFDEPGDYSVVVSITDLGGNQTLVVVSLRVLDTSEKDTNPPVITGATNLVSNIGSIITYAENITVFDAYDGKLDVRNPAYFKVDSSAVRPNSVGIYPVVYTATDRAGNSTSVTVQIQIQHMDVDDATVYAYADTILSGIVSDSMTRTEKIQSIFRYVYNLTENFSTDVTSDYTDRYTRQAYYGFLGYAGDPYTACSMMRLLFDTVGIEYKVVTRSASDFSHWWLLIDFGSGWFHVDALQNGYLWTTDGRVIRSDSEEAKNMEIDKIRFAYQMTDADLAEYTHLINAHRPGWNYYTFDNDAFPPTPTRNSDGSFNAATYTLQYIAGTGGTISGIAAQAVEHGVSGSTVVAVPGYMYRFVRWDDGVTSPERSDAVNGDRTYKAIFEFDPTSVVFYKLEYLAGEGGYLIGATAQNLRENSEGTAITAVADIGYRFIGWSDGKTDVTRTDIATSSLTITALFEKIEEPVTPPDDNENKDDEEEKKPVIYVDAGHGFANTNGTIDRGAGENTAYHALTGKYESDLNLEIALKLREILLELGYEVLMTRESESDECVLVADRVERVNASNADIFISIHGNSYTSESVKGARVYYSSGNANVDTCIGYANTVAAAINQTQGASLKNVTVQDHPNIAVIRGILVPTVLVETCFLTSPEDAALAANAEWIETMATALSLGIQNQLAK